MTGMPVLTPGALELSETSVAVTVFVAASLSVTLNWLVPATSAAFVGSVAAKSLELIPTLSVVVLTIFQLASTALTVTLKAVSGDWTLGVPVLPLAVPGAAVSPGANTCNWMNGPALSTTAEETVLLKPPLLKLIVIVSATG